MDRNRAAGMETWMGGSRSGPEHSARGSLHVSLASKCPNRCPAADDAYSASAQSHVCIVHMPLIAHLAFLDGTGILRMADETSPSTALEGKAGRVGLCICICMGSVFAFAHRERPLCTIKAQKAKRSGGVVTKSRSGAGQVLCLGIKLNRYLPRSQ